MTGPSSMTGPSDPSTRAGTEAAGPGDAAGATEATGATGAAGAAPLWLGTVGLSVVIPAHDDEHRIGPTLDAFRADLDARFGTGRGDWELVVVDDASGDATAALVEAAAADEPRIRLVRSEHHRGPGAALRAGVLASAGERVLLADAGLRTPPAELERLEHALAQADGTTATAALGRSQTRVVRALGIPGIPGFRTNTCGFALFDGDRARAAFGACVLDGPAVDAEVLRWVRRQGWHVVEVPVRRSAPRTPALPGPAGPRATGAAPSWSCCA